MEKIPCSVGILTFNSAHTLRRTLENVKEFDDIVICDGGSTDDTLLMAREYGAHIIAQDPKYKNPDGSLRDFSGPRNQLLEAAKHDWFLYIDSDETISDGLKEDIKRIAAEPTRAGDPLVYRVPYGIVTDGRLIRYSSNYPGYQHRFFNKRSGAFFGKPVHERIYFDKSVLVGTLLHPWLVYGTRGSLLHYIHETGGYRAMEVKAFESRGWRYYVRWGVIKNLRTSLGALLKASRNYLLHGFRDTAPFQDELGRFLSPLILIWLLTKRRIARRFKPSRVEPELARLPALLRAIPDGTVFFDIGANVGAYTKAALKVLPPSRVVAFEPVPELAAGLSDRFAGVRVEAVALSDTQGHARLKVPEIEGVPYFTRSTLTDYADSRESGARYIEVPTDTLDEYCSRHQLVPGVIKIDVEGHEEAVLRGAEKILKENHPALIVEIEEHRLGHSITETFAWLESLGYRGEFFDPTTKSYRPLKEFVIDKHQRTEDFKTDRYVNNFIFV